ncbi:hypothetical protein CLU79DRAFT_767895 [Phycomyces nitens]|nr:hypothetical protein CLU79DRAFT_767895 [Phycomyces nitens]
MALQFPMSRISPIDISALPQYNYPSSPPPPYEPCSRRWTRMAAFKESTLLTNILDYHSQPIPVKETTRFQSKQSYPDSRSSFEKSDDPTALINTLDLRKHMQHPKYSSTKRPAKPYRKHVQNMEETIDEKMEKINISLQRLIVEAQTSLGVSYDPVSRSLYDDTGPPTPTLESSFPPISPTNICQVHLPTDLDNQDIVLWKESGVSSVHFSPVCWLTWKLQEERYIQSKQRINIALEQLEETIQHYSDDKQSKRRESNKRKSAPPLLYNQHQQSSLDRSLCRTPKTPTPQQQSDSFQLYSRPSFHSVKSTAKLTMADKVNQPLLCRIRHARSPLRVLFSFSLIATYSGRRKSVSNLILPWMSTHPWCVVLLATAFLAMTTLSSTKYHWPGPVWMLRLLLQCQKSCSSIQSPPQTSLVKCHKHSSRSTRPKQKHFPVFIYFSHILSNVFQ